MTLTEFRRAYPWAPQADDQGHAFGPGTVMVHPVLCRPDCPAIGADGRTHLSMACRVLGCSAPTLYPPGHEGPLPDQG